MMQFPAEFKAERILRKRSFHDEQSVDDPMKTRKDLFRVNVYNVIVDRIIAELENCFTDLSEFVVSSFECLLPAKIMNVVVNSNLRQERLQPSELQLSQLRKLMEFYKGDLW